MLQLYQSALVEVVNELVLMWLLGRKKEHHLQYWRGREGTVLPFAVWIG